MVTSSLYAEGWGGSVVEVRVAGGGVVLQDIVIDPEGVEYIQAPNNQRADLICDHTKGRFPELGRSRWRKLDTSPAARKARRDARLVTQGERARIAKQDAKAERNKNPEAVTPREDGETTKPKRRTKRRPRKARSKK